MTNDIGYDIHDGVVIGLNLLLSVCYRTTLNFDFLHTRFLAVTIDIDYVIFHTSIDAA